MNIHRQIEYYGRQLVELESVGITQNMVNYWIDVRKKYIEFLKQREAERIQKRTQKKYYPSIVR